MPKVSVVIPCYNQGQYIDEAVLSVLAQTFEDFEIIIVDDGSTDPETHVLLSAYSKPKTKVIQTENQGLAAARNNGVNVARGEYILPLDADDRIGATYLEEAIKVLETESDIGIVYCKARLFGAQDTEWNLPDFSLQEMLVDNVIFCSALFRRADWELAGGYDSGMKCGWEDYDFWLSLLELGRRVYCIPKQLFYYRVSADSMVRARPRQHKLETFARIYRKHQQLFSDNIETWIDKLLDVRETYHEARLLVDGMPAEDADARFFRKVDTGTTRLEFDLGNRASGQLTFQPAEDCSVVSLKKVTLVAAGGEEHDLVWVSNADLVEVDTCFFTNESPVVKFDLPNGAGIDQQAGKRLVIELEYHCIGKECIPFLVEKYKQKIQTRVVKPSPKRACKNSEEKKERKRIMQFLLFFFNRRKVEHYRILSKSSLFDSKYYCHKYDDLNPLFKLFPLAHYIYTGWCEERSPNVFFELFDREWYLENNPDAEGIDPLLHFVQSGCIPKNGLNPLFFDEYYREQYLEDSVDNIPPILHYMTVGWQEGANPNPFFDTRFYQAENSTEIPPGMNPLVHYLHFGFDQQVHPLSFFDTSYYVEDNPAVARQRLPLLYHYIRYGAREGRSPNRFFDPVYYRQENGLEDQPGRSVFEHYVTKGCRENRRPNPFFDSVFYGETYPEYKTSHLYPLLHYQETGVFEGNSPCREVADLDRKPVVSILTPVFNTDEHLLRRCIHSVLYQAYPHWELCLVDDGSSEDHVRQVLEEYVALDGRIKVRFLEDNSGISAASNEAATLATGEYIGFLDHDDELTIDALYEVVRVINEQNPDVIYTDEDLVNLESRHLEPFYKPDYNAELLLSHNYITHFLVTRRDLFEAVGGFSREYSGAQDYDLFLKLMEKSKGVKHIPKILYHWRAHETSTSINHEQKEYANEAGRKALAAALKRRGTGGTVENTELKFFYRVKRKLADGPLISLIGTGPMGNDHLAASVQRILQSTSYSNVEVILPRMNDTVSSVLERLSGDNVHLQLVDCAEDMGEIAWKNRAAEEAGGDYLAFVDLSLHLQDKDWLNALLEYARQEETGMTGGRVDSPTPGIQHTGTVPDLSNTSWYYYVSFVRDVSVHLNGMHCPQHVQYVPESLCMIRRDRFLDVGGFSDRFSLVPFAGLDLCRRLSEKGLLHVFTPHCRALGGNEAIEHLLSMSEIDAAAREKMLFQKTWHDRLVAGDPFYNRMVLTDNSIPIKEFLAWYAGPSIANSNG